MPNGPTGAQCIVGIMLAKHDDARCSTPIHASLMTWMRLLSLKIIVNTAHTSRIYYVFLPKDVVVIMFLACTVIKGRKIFEYHTHLQINALAQD